MARKDLDFCYLTTVGRKSGLARTIEIWFGMERDTVYLLSGGGEDAHWVQNLRADSRVRVKLGRNTYLGTGRLISAKEEDAKARRLLAAKYQEGAPGRRLSSWARHSLPVAVDLQAAGVRRRTRSARRGG